MAFDLHRRTQRGRSRRAPMAEINVTPLVDVMLVLLIVFMVTAPLLKAGVPVDLPDSRAKALAEAEGPVGITLSRTGEVWIDELPVAPFVGLFGTVWGIMRSFTGIAQAQNTSLAVVAPGIAEALFATALGLFAAIPAVIAYNRFGHRLNRLEAKLGRFADGFHTTLSRELDRAG